MPTDNLQPATDNSLRIRRAVPDDIPEILSFIRELAEYEREPASAIATHDDLLRDGFGPVPRFHCLIAELILPEDSQPATSNSQPAVLQRASNNQQPTTVCAAGFALYFYNYSTWRGHAGIYVEDLFVRPAFRGNGIGKALLAAVAAVAVAERCPRLEWAVLDWNTPAVDFYHSLGAASMSEWTIMRVGGEALATLAAQGELP